MRLLFLDIDGVLNDHNPMPNGMCGMQADKVRRLNRILAEIPDLLIVVSSAWRYVVHRGFSNLEGLEHLFLTHGIDCQGRVHGVTEADAETFDPNASHKPPYDVDYWEKRGLKWRVQQIRDYCEKHSPVAFIVLDDLDLDIEELVCTAEVVEHNGILVPVKIGLDDHHVTEVLRRFEVVK